MYLAHLEKLNRTRLADVLVEEGVLNRARVEEAQAEQDSTGKQLGQILIEGEVISDYDLAKIVVTHYSLPYLDIANYSMRREVTTLLPEEFRHRWAIQPLDQFGSILTLAVSEIPAPEQIEEIVETTNLTPILFVAARHAVLAVIDEERKRSASRAGAKAAAKHAAVAPKTGAVAASAPAPAAHAAAVQHAPKTGPVAPSAPAPDLSLPEFDLPAVTMKLASGSSAGRPPAPGIRGGATRDAGVAPKPGASVAAKPGPAGALSWMDAVGGTKPAAGDPKASKFQRPAAGVPSPAVSPARPAAPPAKGAAPAVPAKPAAPAAGGSWQTIFDAADESVKKPKQ
jgi:hypothetical protein